MAHHRIEPQPGPQSLFLASPADIAIYGGAAGGGKTYSLLLEPLRHLKNSLFRGVIFRRTSPQIRNLGGLWDESAKLYSRLNMTARETNLDWMAQSGWQLKFSHLEMEADKYNWQGSQMCFLGFDELTHFSESQFFYLLSRLRSMSGVRGYVRATCNPDADSWLSNFLSWWINPESGYPIFERSGQLRWFVRIDDELEWANTKEELKEKFGEDCAPKSVTFIAACIEDNQVLLQKDPAYLSNLKALPLVEREKLLRGNWKIRAAAGTVFRSEWFNTVDKSPQDGMTIRFWDRAATIANGRNDPDWTVGCKMRVCPSRRYWIEDIVRFRGSPAEVERKMLETAYRDGKETWIGLSQDPGQAGVVDVSYLARRLAGFNVRITRETGSKVVRSLPLASLAESRNLILVRGQWNADFLKELEGFPDLSHDDQVDALAGAFSVIKDLADYQGPSIRRL